MKLPVIETLVITNVTDSTASGGGNITDDGGATITERGLCWSMQSLPTITDSKTSEGTGTGNFTSNLTGLSGSTTYYVKAYAINSIGTGYGMTVSFRTSASLPTIITEAATNLLPNSATLNGIVNPRNLSTVVTFEYGIDTTYGNVSVATQSPLRGSINKNVSTNITGLVAGTTYHYRIKTENTLGVTFGSDVTFKTSGQIPSSTTQSASNILPYSATINALVNPNYLSTNVIFEYGPDMNYGFTVTASQSPITGSSNVSVSANITGLSLVTTYHYRVKSENALGMTYGNDMSFKTAGQAPSSTTKSATKVTPGSVTLNGAVNAYYLETSVKFEYGLTTSYGDSVTFSQNPVTSGASMNVSADLTGLQQATTYHFRIKAVNILGTSYGSDLTFTTIVPVTDIDGNTYKTIKIGNQVWMAENLRTTKYKDGSSIILINTSTGWTNLTSPAYCWYNDKEADYKTTYGALYSWYAVYSGNLCPAGWHLPTDAEWTTLTNTIGPDAGNYLKEQGTSHWQSPNTGANNESGFTALPGGFRNNSGQFNSIGTYGYWWCSNEYNSSNAYFRNMYFMTGTVTRSYISKSYGHSVRCLKD